MNVPKRGSDVFLVEDIKSIIEGLLVTNEAAMMVMPADAASDAYRRGFAAAAFVIAMALGITLDKRLISR